MAIIFQSLITTTKALLALLIIAHGVDGADPFLGEIKMFAGPFAPQGWMFCNGQLLQIGQFTALFSIIGTTYGGDGSTTFGLPDLRGRAPVHSGTGPGLTPIALGSKVGQESVTLGVNNLPNHNHEVSHELNTEPFTAPVDVFDLTTETTVDLSEVTVASSTIELPPQTCPLSGGSSSGPTGALDITTNVFTTSRPKSARFCRYYGKRCEPAFSKVLVRERDRESVALTGSAVLSGSGAIGAGEAECPAQEVTIPAGSLQGDVSASTTVEAQGGIANIGDTAVQGDITVEEVGNGASFSVRSPVQAVSFIIAVQGVFPST